MTDENISELRKMLDEIRTLCAQNDTLKAMIQDHWPESESISWRVALGKDSRLRSQVFRPLFDGISPSHLPTTPAEFSATLSAITALIQQIEPLTEERLKAEMKSPKVEW
jgi:hypothetical protein